MITFPRGVGTQKNNVNATKFSIYLAKKNKKKLFQFLRSNLENKICKEGASYRCRRVMSPIFYPPALRGLPTEIIFKTDYAPIYIQQSRPIDISFQCQVSIQVLQITNDDYIEIIMYKLCVRHGCN